MKSNLVTQITKHNVSLIIILFLLAAAFQISIRSFAQELPFISAINKQNLKEVRLGKSNYYLSLPVYSPDTFKISEAHGIEGQYGCSVIFKDSSSIKSFFIDISSGLSVANNSDDHIEGEPFAKYLLCGKVVLWIVYKTSKDYFNAFTVESENLNAHFYTKDEKDIN